ncbi:MAG: hypothetical protein QW587_08330 [Candidatus Bathyarchaeia archaeon]
MMGRLASQAPLKNRRPAGGSGADDRLARELERLKRETGLGQGLLVKWCPDADSDRHGEVKGDVIYVYDMDEERALATVKHEFIDYHISKEIVEPLVEYVNMQKRTIEALIYRRKEVLVERLSKLR